MCSSDLESLIEIGEPCRFGTPTINPAKVICVGINNKKHANETNIEPKYIPELLLKSPSSLCGANDDIIIPSTSDTTDWEVEMAFVISKKSKNVSRELAMDYIAGYALFNDLSERTLQFEFGSQWTKGKSLDTRSEERRVGKECRLECRKRVVL